MASKPTFTQFDLLDPNLMRQKLADAHGSVFRNGARGIAAGVQQALSGCDAA